jgi:GcrA cell cycle regulator
MIMSMMSKEFEGEVTRNSIIGKKHRLGLESRAPTLVGRPNDGSLTKNIRQKKTPPAEVKRNIERIEKKMVAKDSDIPVEQRKTIWELQNCHCRFPVGDVGTEGFFFCGHPSASLNENRPYCEAHALRVTT